MHTRWNPKGRTTNCGFCSISFALERQTRTLRTADELYDQTLAYFGIERVPGVDPVSRQLLFEGYDRLTGKSHGDLAVPTNYKVLEGKRGGVLDYTISRVAERAGLNARRGSENMIEQMIEFARGASAGWRLPDFIEYRIEELQDERPNAKLSETKIARNIEDTLVGTSILGATDRAHFVNLVIDGAHVEIHDAQSGAFFSGDTLPRLFNKVGVHLIAPNAEPNR